MDLNESYGRAAAVLAAGGVVALPTDTVYGLCARAGDASAVERVYAIKRRDPQQAMPIFIASLEQAETVGRFGPTARALAARFWPGALTIIVAVVPGFTSRALAGGATVALRAPGDARLRALCAQAGPLTGTSANIAGREECHTAAEVASQMGEGVPLIVDAPVDAAGQPSTIVDATSEGSVRIIRAGAVSREEVAAALAGVAALE